MTPADVVLAALLAGALIGFVLSLVGGGGSILAVPLLVYFVGVDQPHVAIGTAALAVALNAGVGLVSHARSDNVRWPCGIAFAIAGVAGAALGAELGKAVDGQALLGLFGGLMVVVGLAMFRRGDTVSAVDVRMTRENARSLLLHLLPTGFAVGLLAGFFGIGGGFLIVPGLILAAGLPIGRAIGTSLVAITAMGATTALSYAASGLVDWQLVLWLVLGGLVGALIGRWAHKRLADRATLLNRGFAIMVIAIGLWVAANSLL